MDADGLHDLFAPFGPVTVSRMFGGTGVWSDGVMIAVAFSGEVYMKTDAENEALFAAETPFSFRRGDKVVTTSLRCLPAECFDEPDMLVRYAASALEAARRSAARKPLKQKKIRG